MKRDEFIPETGGDHTTPSDQTPFRRKSGERAFVVQFDPIENTRSRLRGRVEVVASGEHTRFRSIKGMVEFMVLTLRKPPHRF
jgi:hypothetical protein